MGMVFEGWIVDAGDARLLVTAPDVLDKIVFERDADVDLDKAWHGVHFVLTGSVGGISNPAGQAVLGGEPVGPDQGYGPARLLEPGKVQAVAAVLQALDVQRVRDDYDGDRLEEQGVYPSGIWHEDDILDSYLIPNLDALRDFYARAGRDQAWVLLVIR